MTRLSLSTLFRDIRDLATQVALLGALILFTSCGSQKPYSSAQGNVQVKIPIVKNGQFTLDIVQLTGISDLSRVEGRFARFFFAPRIEGQHIGGDTPRTQFVEARGVYVPANQLSAEMAAVYYHMQNLAGLDSTVGADGINKWPRDIGVQAVVIEEDGSQRKNNAMYDGVTDSITFVPFQSSEIPISVNPGIIAHEHFHSLFFKLVTKPLVDRHILEPQSLVSLHAIENGRFSSLSHRELQTDLGSRPTVDQSETIRQIYQWFILKALNEGLADVWGWAYTGQVDFIAFSLPSQRADRTLEAQATSLYYNQLRRTEDLIENEVKSHLQYTSAGRIDVERTKTELVMRSAYDVGVLYSRFFKAYADMQLQSQSVTDIFSVQAVNGRTEMLKSIIRMLPKIKQKIQSLTGQEVLDASGILEILAESEQSLTQAKCNFISAYLNRTWQGISHAPTYSCVATNGQLQLHKQIESAQ